MTDHDALVRAICEDPDDDTPRLIFADFLDETGEPDRAAFVRAQIELARTPAWEPFGVLCRRRKPEWAERSELEAVRRALPPFPSGWNVEWHEAPFRRGFGWRVKVGSLSAWNDLAPRLFEQVPVGELDLYAMDTLDDWRAFAAAEWTRHLRVIRLYGTSPAEPIRALREAPRPPGITDIYFDRATSPGLAFTVGDLLRTPLGRSTRGLHFRMGFGSLEDLIDELSLIGIGPERLSLTTMGLTPDLIRQWCDRGGPVRLSDLDLGGNDVLGDDGVRVLADGLSRCKSRLTVLGLAGARVGVLGMEALAACEALRGMRLLDLSRNYLRPAAVRALARSEALGGLRSINLTRCRLGDRALRRLTTARFWPNLVELDLRGNDFGDGAIPHLLAAAVPPDLTALLLDGPRFRVETRAALREHFGDRVILDGDQA
jgi:uncharacterized protein (TIGR02996 family)